MNLHKYYAHVRREHAALFLIILLSILLDTLHINREGYGNLYYAAGVKSMLINWHNFFYLSYDPGSFVTIDKPPLGFWLQAASAYVFGFHGWALMLPQILAGIFSVLLLYRLVRQVFGPAAGLAAALILAVTPISVATARNNTIDSVLVLTELVSVWMLYRACGKNGGLGWLLAAAATIGVGFNIKMLAAYLILPAFGLFFMISSHLVKRLKLFQLSFALLVLIAVSLSWAIIVDLTPAAQRPYIGSTQHNSVMELATQHNAVGRFSLGSHAAAAWHPIAKPIMKGIVTPLPEANYKNMPIQESALTHVIQSLKKSVSKIGPGPGPWRMFSPDVNTQVGWLLPLALVGTAFLLWGAPLSRPSQLSLQERTVLFWFMWLLPMWIFFSGATLFHRYYTVMMAPAIAVLSGVTLVRLWQAVFQRKRSGRLIFVLLPSMAAFSIFIVSGYIGLYRPIAFIILVLVLLSQLTTLLWIKWPQSKFRDSMKPVIVSTGLLALLAGPMVWSWIPSIYGAGGSDPIAGPELKHRGTADPINGEQKTIAAYLETHYVKGDFLVATPSAEMSSPIILETGLPVMTLGGYSGADPILTNQQLQLLVKRDKVKYFLLPRVSNMDQELPFAYWIRGHCRLISTLSSDTSSPSIGLYQYTG